MAFLPHIGHQPVAKLVYKTLCTHSGVDRTDWVLLDDMCWLGLASDLFEHLSL